LADALREEDLKLPDGGQRDRLVSGLIQLRELLTGGSASPLKAEQATSGQPVLPEPPGGARSALEGAAMFTPRDLVIGYFTESKNFAGKNAEEGDQGLEVRIRPLDQFGDPTKAVGWYRIEVFQYRPHSGEKRGERLGHWIVKCLDADSNRKYYDPVDRSYVFPLLWEKPVASGSMVVVQATYYPPAGFQEKLFAQRVIRVGGE
jgi:hypothetical protein